MTRYTINVGDDFPVGEEENGRGRRFRLRFGMALKVLFFVAVVAIVVHHPFHVALITGVILLLRRSDLWERVRERIRAGGGLLRADGWRAEAQRWAEQYRGRCGAQRQGWKHERHGRGHGRDHSERGFREFV